MPSMWRLASGLFVFGLLAACADPQSVARRSALSGSGVESPVSSGSAHAVPGSAVAASSTTLATRSATAVVPWVDRPAPPYQEPSPTPFPTDARPCRPADLKVVAGYGGVAAGNFNVRISFTNVSHSTCVLVGYPKVFAVSAAGAVTSPVARIGSYFGDPGPPANIAPGEVAALNISGSTPCEHAQISTHLIYPKLRINFPAGGWVDLTKINFDSTCGIWVSAFGVPALTPGPPPDPPMSPLAVQINAPATAYAGQTLSYTVTIANDTNSPVSLTPCPAYTESLGSGVGDRWVATVKDYYLNCDAVHEIAAHSSVTYEMRLQLPADQPPSRVTKFGWGIQGGSGPGTGGPIQVLS